MSITDWPAQERPREKLLQRGADALSDAELLAIFLRTGVAGKTAVDLARDLLQRIRRTQKIARRRSATLLSQQRPGSGQVRPTPGRPGDGAPLSA